MKQILSMVLVVVSLVVLIAGAAVPASARLLPYPYFEDLYAENGLFFLLYFVENYEKKLLLDFIAGDEWQNIIVAIEALQGKSGLTYQEVRDADNVIYDLLYQGESHFAAIGDVNRDGNIDSSDARLALQCEVGLIELTWSESSRGNVDDKWVEWGDRFTPVDSTDARMILQYEVGLIRYFPAESWDGWRNILYDVEDFANTHSSSYLDLYYDSAFVAELRRGCDLLLPLLADGRVITALEAGSETAAMMKPLEEGLTVFLTCLAQAGNISKRTWEIVWIDLARDYGFAVPDDLPAQVDVYLSSINWKMLIFHSTFLAENAEEDKEDLSVQYGEDFADAYADGLALLASLTDDAVLAEVQKASPDPAVLLSLESALTSVLTCMAQIGEINEDGWDSIWAELGALGFTVPAVYPESFFSPYYTVQRNYRSHLQDEEIFTYAYGVERFDEVSAAYELFLAALDNDAALVQALEVAYSPADLDAVMMQKYVDAYTPLFMTWAGLGGANEETWAFFWDEVIAVLGGEKPAMPEEWQFL